MIDSVSDTESRPDLKRSRRVTPTPNTDRLPPHSPEAEKGVLGCILMNPSESLPQMVIRFGDAGGEVLYDLRHYTIFNAMVNLADKGIPVDVISLMTDLKNNGLLEQVGGLLYLSSLEDDVPSAANLSYYADIVIEKYVLRKALHTCADVVSRIYSYEGEVDELLDSVERDILNIRITTKEDAIPSMRDTVSRSVQRIEDMAQNAGRCTGLSTGFPDLDKMTSGMSPGQMIVIAARPGFGKTSLAMNIAEHVATELKLAVGVFSLEMPRDDLVMRMICSRAKVNLRNVQQGYMAERDIPRLTGVAGKLANTPIHIDDTGGLTILQVRARARRMVQQYGIKLFVIDYIQLVHATLNGRRIEKKNQEIAEVSNGIKEMAKELGVPVIVLAQINRDLDREKRKPVMSDLRESGAIEQDADFIGFLYTPKTEKEDDEQDYGVSEVTMMNLLIAKQRSGPTGEIPFTFLKAFTRFESAAKVSDEDVAQQTF